MNKWRDGFVLDAIPPKLNEVIDVAKSHWSQYSDLKKVWTERVAWELKSQGMPKITDQPLLEFHWYCKDKRTDKDNIAFSKKFVLDGMVTAGVLEDDAWNNYGNLSDIFYVDEDNPRLVLKALK